jgi:hypothetical protein
MRRTSVGLLAGSFNQRFQPFLSALSMARSSIRSNKPSASTSGAPKNRSESRPRQQAKRFIIHPAFD